MNTRKEELKKLIIKGLIGVVVGVILATSSGDKSQAPPQRQELRRRV